MDVIYRSGWSFWVFTGKSTTEFEFNALSSRQKLLNFGFKGWERARMLMFGTHLCVALAQHWYILPFVYAWLVINDLVEPIQLDETPSIFIPFARFNENRHVMCTLRTKETPLYGTRSEMILMWELIFLEIFQWMWI